MKPKGLVIVVSDAYGWDFVNTRLLADRYARKGGFLVYVPDFMRGVYLFLYLTCLVSCRPASFVLWYFVRREIDLAEGKC